ncbi:hypothetical protein [Vibrio comitans]|uniref:Uncharacterized protein n=1 Tax=Vibrio comitans NBRC 102076 TaxID=1219078 RepID=A0A4Y3INT7_9VIBR|nr:hypothetical protein [Vibrio comitans]GEA60380.1 hypothetical protein VCO01S_15730 [Vibrio comitans NBRC 102076]
MPSQLSNCVIEIVNQSSITDYSGWISLLITVVGWPIVYSLGLKVNRKTEINKTIDQLDDSIMNLRKHANSLIDKSFYQSDYLTMVALTNRVRVVCERIEQLDKSMKKPQSALREIKKIATDELFHSKNKNNALSKLHGLEFVLNNHYKKSM